MSTAQIHHIFPKNYLVKNDIDRSDYNKVANFAYLRDDINIKIADREPAVYISMVKEYKGAFGSDISNINELKQNFNDNAIPQLLEEATYQDFQEFMKQRRLLMSQIVKEYFSTL